VSCPESLVRQAEEELVAHELLDCCTGFLLPCDEWSRLYRRFLVARWNA
jgi:hypothetical protein